MMMCDKLLSLAQRLDSAASLLSHLSEKVCIVRWICERRSCRDDNCFGIIFDGRSRVVSTESMGRWEGGLQGKTDVETDVGPQYECREDRRETYQELCLTLNSAFKIPQ